MTRRVAFALLVMGAHVLAAPADFARGRVVEVVDEQLVQRVALPQDVYEWVTRRDLGDVRVFNGDHEVLPYRLQRPQKLQEFSEWTPLPVFVLPSDDVGTRPGASVNVEVDDGGAVVAVNSELVSRRQPAAFLVDASGFDNGIAELALTWSTVAQDYVGRFRVEVSDDLDQWRTLVASASLAALSTDGHSVLVDRITLPGTSVDYLKLTQLEGSERIQVNTVRARARLAQLPERRWKTFAGRAVNNGYEFEIDGLFPFDRIGVELAGDSYLVIATLYSRAAEDQAWRRRGRHTFYRVEVNGSPAMSEGVGYSVADRYWRAELADGADRNPQLRVGWLPDELVFLKQGPAPYLMVYGRAGVEGRQWPLTDLLARLGAPADLDALAPAELAAATMLGGEDRLTPPPEPIDWQTLVLWAVLLCGVLVVGFFAWRLLREPDRR